MSNRSYNKGRAAEYKTMCMLERAGYICFRTAGSHGLFDVIAFLKSDQTELELPIIRAIQCKATKYIAKEDIAYLKSCNLPETVQKEIWHFRPRQKVTIIHC